MYVRVCVFGERCFCFAPLLTPPSPPAVAWNRLPPQLYCITDTVYILNVNLKSDFINKRLTVTVGRLGRPRTHHWLLRPIRVAKYCVECVCLSVCASVCSRNSKTTWPNFNNFYAFCLWPWLGPPLTVLRYVMYFRFYG